MCYREQTSADKRSNVGHVTQWWRHLAEPMMIQTVQQVEWVASFQVVDVSSENWNISRYIVCSTRTRGLCRVRSVRTAAANVTRSTGTWSHVMDFVSRWLTTDELCTSARRKCVSRISCIQRSSRCYDITLKSRHGNISRLTWQLSHVMGCDVTAKSWLQNHSVKLYTKSRSQMRCDYDIEMLYRPIRRAIIQRGTTLLHGIIRWSLVDPWPQLSQQQTTDEPSTWRQTMTWISHHWTISNDDLLTSWFDVT